MRAISAGRIWKSLFNRNHLAPKGKLPDSGGPGFPTCLPGRRRDFGMRPRADLAREIEPRIAL
jgi:hypothetical protein